MYDEGVDKLGEEYAGELREGCRTCLDIVNNDGKEQARTEQRT